MSSNNLQVIMGNELIRAAHNLSLMEKRVLMFAVSTLDSTDAKNQQNTVIRLSVLELAKEFNIDKSSAYREIKKAVRGVRKRYIRLWEKNSNGKVYDTDISWTTKATYADSEGWIELSLNGDLNPFLYELKKHFTSYSLSRAGALRSNYAWRLFELLMQFKSTGYVKIFIDEFHHSLETPKTYQRDFSLLRLRVIEPAVKEIKEKDGLKVTWKTIKTGRKVTSLEFTFPPETQTELPNMDTVISKIDDALVNRYVSDNPELTRGKTYKQIIKQLKEVYPKAKVTSTY